MRKIIVSLGEMEVERRQRYQSIKVLLKLHPLNAEDKIIFTKHFTINKHEL